MKSRLPSESIALTEKSQVLLEISRCVRVNVKRKASIQWLLKVLAQTDDAQIRNDAALALGDLRVQTAAPIIARLLSDEAPANNRGSLLYALQFLDYQNYLDEIAFQLRSDVYEVMEMALQLLEQLPPRLKESQTRSAISQLKHILIVSSSTVHANYVNQGLKLLQTFTRSSNN